MVEEEGTKETCTGHSSGNNEVSQQGTEWCRSNMLPKVME